MFIFEGALMEIFERSCRIYYNFKMTLAYIVNITQWCCNYIVSYH